MDKLALLAGLDKIHTTDLGVVRVRRNLGLDATVDVVAHCKDVIKDADTTVMRKGKNFYATSRTAIITVNASKWSIITAHRVKK